jgi:catechol 2,3-dioxygenase-like lactoylglutathione lyase family enzyme
VFQLANVAAELIAPAGDGSGADSLRAVLDDQGEGLASLAFAVDDVERAHRRLARLGLHPEPVVTAESVDRASGVRRRWRRTRAATAATHGVRVFLIQREAPLPAAPPAGPGGVTGLDHVVVRTPDPERAAALYGARLGLDMRLDRSNPAWGARLMFFRCGDLIVELAHDLRAGVSAGPDRLWGLSWRTDDPPTAIARLRGAGLDVSDARPGRKPGTQVFTVRDGTCGVPTLMLQPSA